MTARTWAVLCLVGGLAAAGAGCGDADEEPAGPKPSADRPVTITFSATALDGSEVTLKQFHGKVVLVDMFGTWCTPCQNSTPVLVSLYHRYHSRGFEIVGLAYEPTPNVEEAREIVRLFATQFSVPYTLAIGPQDLKKQIPGGFEGYPTMLLVDRQGAVRQVDAGWLPGHEAVLSEQIEKLLAEPAAPAP